jgi:hypothetical protein
MGTLKNFYRSGPRLAAPLFWAKMEGHPVAVHQVPGFLPAQENVLKTGIFRYQKAKPLPVQLNPTNDNLRLRR